MVEVLEKSKVSYNYDRLLSCSEIGILCEYCNRINLLYVSFLTI